MLLGHRPVLLTNPWEWDKMAIGPAFFELIGAGDIGSLSSRWADKRW
jgi:hypothetical protein